MISLLNHPRVGDVVYLHVFGQGLLFLNTYEAAIDLLEKKGSIYSDKPALVMAGELYVRRAYYLAWISY